MRRFSAPDSPLLAAIVCAGSGLSVSFCFWPYRTAFAAYFVLVPFVIFSGLRDGRGKVLLNCFLFGFAYFMGSLYWIAMLEREQIAIPELRLPAAIVLCLYLSLFVILTGFLVRRLTAFGIPFEISFAVAWAGIEYLRSLGPLGFPWASIGYSQTAYLSAVQQAAVVGIYGVSAWVVLVNGLITRALISRRIMSVMLAAIVFAGPVIGGRVVLARTGYDEGVRLSLVQPNIAGNVKWDEHFRNSTMALLSAMTVEAGDVSMIVWPETAVPFYVKHVSSSLDSIGGHARSTGSYILFGFPDYERRQGEITYYNSAMLISPDGQVAGEYRKIHLVPFGERIPFEDHLRILKRIDLGEGDFSPGEEYEIFDIDGRRFAVAICFESIYPSLVREFVSRGSQFIVNITNDEWFGPSIGPYQHAQMAIMRAVEFRVGLARCANTGISMFVDPFGRVTSSTDIFRRQTLAGEVAIGSGRTPYLALGRYIEGGMLLGTLILALATYLGPARRRKQIDTGLQAVL